MTRRPSPVRCCRSGSAHLYSSDKFNFDSNVKGQFGKSHRTSSVMSGFAEYIDEKIRASVYDSRGLVEAGSDIDHAEDFDDPLDPIEIT